MNKFLVFCLSLFALTTSRGFGSQRDLLDDPKIEKAVEHATEARYEQALELFSSKLQEDPASALLNYYVGLTHLYLGHKKQAVDHLEKSLAKEAPFPQVFYWCAQAHLASDDLKTAEKILNRGIEEFPRNRKLMDLIEEVRVKRDG